jgi:hypothetical protein
MPLIGQLSFVAALLAIIPEVAKTARQADFLRFAGDYFMTFAAANKF